MNDEYLKRCLYCAFQKFLDESLAEIRMEDCIFTVDEQTALRLGKTQEVIEYCKGMSPVFNGGANFPSELFGFRTDCVRAAYSTDGYQTSVRQFAILVCRIPDTKIVFTCEIILPPEDGK